MHSMFTVSYNYWFEGFGILNFNNSAWNLLRKKSLSIFTENLWLYVLVMSRTHFRVNPHSIFAWMSRDSLLETSVISEPTTRELV